MRWLRVGLALGLLALLFWRVDLGEVTQALRGLPLLALVGVVLLLVAQFPLSAWKWHWALRVAGARLGGSQLLRFLCIGFFINNFLPSAIGGDAYRVWRSGQAVGTSVAMVGVMTHRLVGLAALLVLGFLGALAHWDDATLARVYVLVMIAGACVAAAGLGALQLAAVRTWISQRCSVHPRVARLWEAVSLALRPSAAWLPLIGLSLVFQATAAAILWLLFRGLGAPVDAGVAALAGAAAGVAAVVPLSINGIGIVEGSIAGAAVAMGANYEAALLAAIALRVLVIPLSAACGLVWMFERSDATADPARG